MSQNVMSLPSGAAPANTGGAATGKAAASSGSEAASFLDMLGNLDAACPDDAQGAVVEALLQADACDEDTLGELEDLLAMLPDLLPPWQSPAAAVKSGTSMSADSMSADSMSEDAMRGYALRDLDAVPGSGAGPRGLIRAGLLADAGELLAILQPGLPDAQQEPSVDLPALGLAGAEPGQPARAHSAVDGALARPLHQSVGSTAWAQEIATRVNLMAEHGRHTASLRLSPEHLGPVEIRISISEDQASVWFGAAHADTRAALEAALPRLREMFSAQGLSLADSGVFHDAPRQQAVARHHYPSAGPQEQEQEQGASVSMNVRTPLGSLDTYA